MVVQLLGGDVIQCSAPTEHYSSVLNLLRAYDLNSDDLINNSELARASQSWQNGTLGTQELLLLADFYNNQWSISDACRSSSSNTLLAVILGGVVVAGLLAYVKLKK